MGEVLPRYKRGLTWRSLLGLIYITFVFQAAFAYMHLMTGSTPSLGAVQWATILLFVELAAVFAGVRLTLQEAVIIYLASGQTIKYWWFLAPTTGNLSHPGWIYQLYLRHSPVAKALGIAEKIPWFYAPTSPEPWIMRTFLHPEWSIVAMWTMVYFLEALFADLAMSTLTYNVYAVVEKLPFPLVDPVVDTTKAMVERDWRKTGVLAATALASMAYAFVLYTLPLIGRVFWNVSISVIPIPWIDWNSYIQTVLPGSSLGIATDLSVYATGFIIPFQAALGLLIGSIAIQIVGNHLLVSQGWTGFAREYTYGMPIQTIWERTTLWAWTMPIVGFTLAVGIVPLLLHRELIVKAVMALKKVKESAVGISLPVIIGLFLSFSLALAFLDYWLAPDIPLWVYILLNAIWPFFLLLISVRGEGLGVSVGIPYVRELTLKAVGYTGIDAWFVPVYLPSSWVSGFVTCDRTETSQKDYIIAMFIIFPLALIFGFITMQSLWSLAPIPSHVYPGVLYSWPVMATIQSIFISPIAGEFFRVERMIYGLVAGVALYILGDRLGFTALVVGIAGGIGSAIPGALATFIGAVVGRVVMRLVGREWWMTYRGIIFAGVLLGEGLIVTVGTGLAIIMKSMWAAPY
jgi:hypothetical protein